MTAPITPFTLNIPQSDLDDLHERLANTRWPDQLPGVGWAYGTPRDYLRGLADYWQHTYDWRTHEARLNQFPQFTTDIEAALARQHHV